MVILVWYGICLRLFGAMLKYAYCYSFGILIFSLSHLSNMCTMQVPPTETIPQIKKETSKRNVSFSRRRGGCFCQCHCCYHGAETTGPGAGVDQTTGAVHPVLEKSALHCSHALAAHSLHKSQRGVLFLRNWAEDLRPIGFFFS